MSQTKRAYDKFLLYALLIIALGVVGFISATTVIDPNYLNTTGVLIATTLNTGQGANELYDMDQNVLQASAVTFATVDTGQGANEVYDMDQNLLTISSVTFDDVTVTDEVTLGGVTRSTWPSVASGTAIFLDTVTCKIEGTYYVAYLADGTVLYNNTSPFTCLQTALDFTTYNAGSIPTYLEGRVYNYTSVRVGPGYWDIGANDLDIPNKVNFGGEGRDATIIKGSLANAVVKNMWSNYTFAVDIHDMRIENSANSATVLKWTSSSSGLPSGQTYGGGMLAIHRLNLRYTGAGTYCLYVQSTTGDHTRVTAEDIKGSGTMYLSRIFDSYFSGLFISKLQLNGACASNQFSTSYIGGGLDYSLVSSGDTDQWSSYGNLFTNVRFDNPTTSFVNLGGYAQGYQFVGCTFSNLNWNTADNTNDGVTLGANTHHITFTGNRFVNDLESNDAATLRYVFYETSGTNNNTYVGNSYESNIYSDIPLYETGILYTTDPTTSNFENRKQTYQGSATATLNTTDTEYCNPIGIYSPSTNEDLRGTLLTVDGWIANLRCKFAIAPGAGKAREAYVRFNGNDYLLVNITDGGFSGVNNTAIYLDTTTPSGLLMSIKTVPLNTPTASLFYYTYDFYPDPEEWLNLK